LKKEKGWIPLDFSPLRWERVPVGRVRACPLGENKLAELEIPASAK